MALPDNYDMWEAYDRQCAAWEHKLPICELCGEHIQQWDAVRIRGEWYCDECLREARRVFEDD